MPVMLAADVKGPKHTKPTKIHLSYWVSFTETVSDCIKAMCCYIMKENEDK